MLKIAILGASGFVGNRTVEMLSTLEGVAEVRPIVRDSNSLARLSRLDLDYRVANALHQSALAHAFAGCDIVVDSVLSTPAVIRSAVTPTYRAAQQAGVRRIVYLSSASVHGQAPSPGTDERSPLSKRQPFPYNSAKIQAEQRLLKLCSKGSLEVVILRPGIVFGPRSRRISEIADELLAGAAYLVNGGQGICNSIYVDNLVHAIRLATTAPDANREAFLIGDREQVTWANFYRPLAEAFGIDFTQIPHVACPEFTRSWKESWVQPVYDSEPVQKVLTLFSGELKQAVKRAVFRQRQASPTLPQVQPTPSKREPVVTQEMALLHQCQYKFPYDKAEKILGYQPIVSFAEGCDRSIDWLASTGYPVVLNK